MSCRVGHRRGSDPALLWLWRRLAATAPIRPLAWEPPYATGAALKRQKKKITSPWRPEGCSLSLEIANVIFLLFFAYNFHCQFKFSWICQRHYVP